MLREKWAATCTPHGFQSGGVFKSTDKGASWGLYPNTIDNPHPSVLQDGGLLPNVRVTDIKLSIGFINPLTGTYNSSASPNVLMASTYGRGAFAIRAAFSLLSDSSSSSDSWPSSAPLSARSSRCR